MRRSVALKTIVHCPHFDRPITATLNQATEKLVDCSDKDKCHEPGQEYPPACPVFRRPVSSYSQRP